MMTNHAMMMMNAVAAAALLLWSSGTHFATAYFVPGVNPHSYKEGEMYVVCHDNTLYCVCCLRMCVCLYVRSMCVCMWHWCEWGIISFLSSSFIQPLFNSLSYIVLLSTYNKYEQTHTFSFSFGHTASSWRSIKWHRPKRCYPLNTIVCRIAARWTE